MPFLLESLPPESAAFARLQRLTDHHWTQDLQVFLRTHRRALIQALVLEALLLFVAASILLITPIHRELLALESLNMSLSDPVVPDLGEEPVTVEAAVVPRHEPQPRKPKPEKTPNPTQQAVSPTTSSSRTTTVKPPGNDPGDGSEFARRRTGSGGKRGTVNAVLLWESFADLDLVVTLPSGETISYLNPESAGVVKDTDFNARTGGANYSDRPLENVFIRPGYFVPGRYRFAVQLARRGRESGAIAFRALIEVPARNASRVVRGRFPAVVDAGKGNLTQEICVLELTRGGQLHWHVPDNVRTKQ